MTVFLLLLFFSIDYALLNRKLFHALCSLLNIDRLCKLVSNSNRKSSVAVSQRRTKPREYSH